PIHAERLLESCRQTRSVTNAALDHLELALSDPSAICDCREGFLELVAKEAVLKKDIEGLQAATAWGLGLMSEAKKIPS
ncbi:MAG TPA: hypothetical protein VK210_03615, partial [Terriglobia bacterium]|nr:hypothetical protein [Terriglobia bacterium]